MPTAKSPDAISLRARQIAEEFGAEAVVIITLHPNAKGDGWDAHHSAYMANGVGLDWERIGEVVRDCAADIVGEPVVDEPAPS